MERKKKSKSYARKSRSFATAVAADHRDAIVHGGLLDRGPRKRKAQLTFTLHHEIALNFFFLVERPIARSHDHSLGAGTRTDRQTFDFFRPPPHDATDGRALVSNGDSRKDRGKKCMKDNRPGSGCRSLTGGLTLHLAIIQEVTPSSSVGGLFFAPRADMEPLLGKPVVNMNKGKDKEENFSKGAPKIYRVASHPERPTNAVPLCAKVGACMVTGWRCF
ncbi:hypothetical protein J3F83DRAFT_738788 [Trichoderma novae-zelandiae]